MNFQSFKIVFYKSLADLKTENSRYFLSFLWWFFDPIMYFAVFYFLFASGFRGGENGPEYAVYLIVGLTAFRWITSTVNSASRSVVANQRLNNQIYLPKWVFPLNVFFVNTVKFIVIFLIAVLFAIWNGYPISYAYILIPVVLVVEGIFILGLSFPLAAIVPFVPDLQFIIGNVMMAMFFLSGVFFDISAMPEDVQRILYLNPGALIIRAYRDIMIGAKLPDLLDLAYSAFVGIALLCIGLYLLKRFDKTYAKVSN